MKKLALLLGLGLIAILAILALSAFLDTRNSVWSEFTPDKPTSQREHRGEIVLSDDLLRVQARGTWAFVPIVRISEHGCFIAQGESGGSGFGARQYTLCAVGDTLTEESRTYGRVRGLWAMKIRLDAMLAR